MLYTVDREPSRYPAYLLLLRRQFQAEPLAWGLIRAETIPEPARLGCIRGGFDLLHDAPTLEGLIEVIRAARITEGPFLIEHIRLGRHAIKTHSIEATRALADALAAWPDLNNPAVRFALIETPDHFYFARIQFRLPRPDPSPFIERPWGYSAALSNELALTAVQLVASPGETLVDPTCGSGTILYEALKLGVKAWGYDIHWRWASGTRANLAHFGLTPPEGAQWATVADAREVEFEADAVAANLPYGRRTSTSEEKLEAILTNLRHRARRFVFFSGDALTPLLTRVGYSEIEEVDLSKGPGRQRFMSVAR
ncbi:hypothetical protein KKF91_03405 [Myxococcota bacterium]|nr:hypothetical protein [Myxococcota bacterium]MBU1429588.1 hypothetical protein [Myxococcota bacterium]MBU1897510.1 hypothetical protein [Myxococcota bacterium]